MATSQFEKPGDLQPARVETGPGSTDDTNWESMVEIDEAYLSASKTTKIWRSVLFQMILFGA